MKGAMRLGTTTLALALLAAACGGNKTPAKDGTETLPDVDAGATSDTPATTGDGGTSTGPDDKPAAAPCAGVDLDLNKMLYQASCEVPQAPPNTFDAKGKLEVKVLPPGKVAPGGKTEIVVTFTNKTNAEMPVFFVVDPEPRFSIEVYDAKTNKRVDAPADPEPKLPDSVANATLPEKKTAKVVLAPNGKGTFRIPWEANKQKWAPKDKVKGAIPGQGYPRVAAGPLGKGKYALHVLTPLTGVFEGMDHEVSQPRAELEITP
jgi:hypothetical protein